MRPRATRTIGGPGTGKTRAILSQLTEAKDELGLATDEVALCTFSVAGRSEISERAASEWGVPVESLTKDGWFRTAHSIAYKQCETRQGQLLTGGDSEWLVRAVGARVGTLADDRSERQYLIGDDDSPVSLALQAWDVARNLCCPLRKVIDRINAQSPRSQVTDEAARRTVERYEKAKRRDDRLDYVDLISAFAGIKHSLEGSTECAPTGEVPESIRVLAVDEAQDSSRLVDAVCRRLAFGGNVERVYLTGDPYQSCHGFAGGDYTLFLGWQVDDERIMPQSYRCPPEVMRLGETCLRRMKSGYVDRKIRPAEHSGKARLCAYVDEAMNGIRAGDSVLILGRCVHALSGYTHWLDSRSLPWSWASSSGVSDQYAGFRALYGLSRGEMVCGEDLGHAIAMLAVRSEQHGELLARGEKAAWRDGRRHYVDFVDHEQFDALGIRPALATLIREGRWSSVIEPKRRDRAERWLKAAKLHGVEAASSPGIRVSTIHSAKGLEADIVIMSSRTSAAVERGRMLFDDTHDEECRIAYVGVTRARSEFRYVEEGGSQSMQLPL
jgi:DNA helicase-2/ATP-dependent DNA helicase PcrA